MLALQISLIGLHCRGDDTDRGMQRSVYRASVSDFQQALALLRAQVAIHADFSLDDLQRTAVLCAVLAVLLVTALVL